jgi:hypothetical protein
VCSRAHKTRPLTVVTLMTYLWKHLSKMEVVVRRLVFVTVALAALAAPAVAWAASFDHGFTLGAGANTHRSYKITVGKTGTVTLSLRYSRVVNPNAHFVVKLRKSTNLHGMTLIDTATTRCQGAAGSVYCYGARSNQAPGTYFVSVTKLTTAAAQIELKASYPG